MKKYITNVRIFTAITIILVLTGLLSACGSNQGFNPAGPGVAGLGDDQTPAPTESPIVTDSPAEIPIPETSGHIVFVSNRDGQMSLYKTTPDGIEQVRLTTANSEDTNPRMSPDGTRVAFVSTVDNNMDVYVLDLNTLNIIRVTDAPEKDSAPSWSPDGTQLVFESFRDGNFEIYLANADGSNQTRLTNDPAGDSNPIWSPVRNEIAFVSNRFGNADILLVTPTGTVSTLTTNPAPDSAPAWSPDGSVIAFKSYSGEFTNLCLIGRDALNQHCITSTPAEYGSPVWSPDGTRLAVNAKLSNGYGIDIFNVQDDSVQEIYSAGIEPSGTPVWSPEGARLVFQGQVDGDMELYSLLIPTKEFSRLTAVSGFDGKPTWSRQ
jgi:Tol biopolymer transport system component